MIRRKQTSPSKKVSSLGKTAPSKKTNSSLRKTTLSKTRPTKRSNDARLLIANGVPAPVRKPGKPPSTEPFHVAVDRQLKSGHDTFEDAEKAALKIKNRYPHLHVTVFDGKEGRHKLIERAKANSVPNNNRIAERNAATRGKTDVAGRKH